MQYALMSDVHGNEEAFKKVLEHKAQNFPKAVLCCLGDFLGYGPRPLPCMRLVMKHFQDRVVIGNHDRAVLFSPEKFNAWAETAVLAHREQIDKEEDAAELWRYLANLPRFIHLGDMTLVHCSPLQVRDRYVLPSCHAPEGYSRLLTAMGSAFNRICFVGHSHLPVIFEFKGQNGVIEEIKEFAPQGVPFRLNQSSKYLINVGSVGQPRDRNPRACYVVFDDETQSVVFNRVDYDVKKTIAQMAAHPGLSKDSALRLETGH